MNIFHINNYNPLSAWKELILFNPNHAPVILETDLKKLEIDSDLFKRYYFEYKWHFRDTYRSLLQKMNRELTKYEFSYYDRIHEYFGIDQLGTIIKNQNHIISNWDANKDHIQNPKPCLVLIKLIPDGSFLHLSVVFRARDIIRRMGPNFVAFVKFHKQCSKILNKKMGLLFDYSMQAFNKNDDYERVISWEEFQHY